MTLQDQFESLKQYGYVLDAKHYEDITVKRNGKTFTRRQLVGSDKEQDYPSFKGKGQKAVDYLLQKKSGSVNGAFHRKDIGDIDIVWGKVTDPIKHKGYGLAHIIDKHGEKDVAKLGEAIEHGKMHVEEKNGKSPRYVIEYQNYRAIITQEWEGGERQLVVTGFTRDSKGSSPSISATDNYMVATSPKPLTNIPHDTGEVKFLSDMFERIKGGRL